MLRAIITLMFMLCINAFSISAHAAATPAGTIIGSQSTISYLDTGTGKFFTGISGTNAFANITVNRYFQIEQTENLEQFTPFFQTVYFPRVIKNSGNQIDSYTLEASNLSGDDGELNNLKVYLDSNGDGRVNKGEPEITNTELLIPEQSIQIVVSGVLPLDAGEGDEFKVGFISQSSNQPETKKQNTDVARTTNRSILRINRSSDIQCTTELELGQQSTHEIRFSSVGNQDPSTHGIVVDGTTMEGVLFQENIPAFFTLLKDPAFSGAPVQGIPVVGTPQGEWISYAQWDGQTAINQLGIVIPPEQIRTGRSGNFNFTYEVAEQTNQTAVFEMRTTVDLGGDGETDFESNQICSTVKADESIIIKQRPELVLSGQAFDSANLEALANVQIKLINAENNQEAASIVADDKGYYEFTNVTLGDYYLEVIAPATHSAPSASPPSSFPTYKVGNAAYGRNGYSAEGEAGEADSGLLRLGVSIEALELDIPLDKRGIRDQIATEKTASSEEAAIGELVGYTIKLRNLTGQNLYALFVRDQLPAGFKYIKGTAKVNGEFIENPEILAGSSGSGIHLAFSMGDFDADQEYTLSYVTQVTALANEKYGINTAYAHANTLTSLRVQSPQASARVEIRQDGVLSDRSIVFGRIAVAEACPVSDDENLNLEGYPLADVRLYMEDGTYVITDINGQYSLYGLQPGLHVLKVDNYTLPEGARIALTSAAQAGDPGSRFLDLKPGDFQRADFTIQCPQDHADKITSARIVEEMLANNQVAEQNRYSEVETIDENNNNNLRNLARFAQQDGDISSGLIEAHRYQKQKQQQHQRIKQSKLEQAKKGQEPLEDKVPDPKVVAKTITKSQGKAGTWLWPKGDTSVDGRFMVVVRGGLTPSLWVNDKEISGQQLGEQILNKREKSQILAWYGVELKEGLNDVKVMAKDTFGNARTLLEKTFKRPSVGTEILIKADKALPADQGRSTVPVTLRILDRNGYPARGVYFLTLEASDGQWVEPDIQDKVPGHQVRVINGERTVHLRSSTDVSSRKSGLITLRASTDNLKGEAKLNQISELRPLVAVGLVDIRAHKGFADGYENLGLLQLDQGENDTEFTGRAALFMKGRIKGDMNLTFAYDNQKDEDAELLRDIDPEEYYQVYGDSSQRGFDAQSRSKVYAKIEKDRSSILWGDYITDNDTINADIARVQRTLTGLSGIYDNGQTRLQVFAAEQDNLRGIREIPGNGTALQYQLLEDQANPQSGVIEIVRNSEIVEIITRDKDNLGIILDTERLERFRDYSLDDLTGYFTFHRVIPSLDENLNPVYIRITFDRIEEGEEYLVAGARLTQKITDNFQVGASVTIDEHEDEGFVNSGVFAEYKAGDTKFEIGIGNLQHEEDNVADGNAVRIHASHKWANNSQTEITAIQADETYDNPNSSVIADRREIKLNHRQTLTSKMDANFEYSKSESISTGDERDFFRMDVVLKQDQWSFKAGGRQITEKSDDAEDERINTALIGVERQFKLFNDKQASIKAEYEREVGDDDRHRITVGSEVELTDKTKAYVRYEYADRLSSGTLAGAVETEDALVAGIKSQVLPSTEMFSEYRIDGGLSGRDVVAANGAKATLNLDENLVVTPSIEFLNYLEQEGVEEEDRKEDSVAVSIGLRDTRDKNAKKLLRLETRYANDEQYYGIKGTYVRKLNDSTTVLAQNELRYHTYDDDREDNIENTLNLAAAYRPAGNSKYNALYAYRWEYDDDNNEDTHILSTHQNYRVNERLDLSGRIGGKQQSLKPEEGIKEKSNSFLLDTRAQYDINQRLSLDFHGGALSTNGTDELRYSAGAGFAYNIIDNVRISAGYNFIGFDESDLDPQGYNTEGAYIGLQLKADELFFQWLTD